MAKQNIYTVYIRTGDDTLAGTDSNVFIEMFGTGGSTGEIHLPARDIFSFEAGATDKYILEVPDIGDLTRCCLRQDDSETGPSSGWQVKDVRIEDDETDRVWVFTFDCWLGLEESGTLSACADL
ncbi:MAG: hypothetical protein JW966_03270 [Anaerolineae bacterium]|nr:hypothetical protein [Anaerolineae bacterium]